MVVALTAGTNLEPLHYERELLARFERGDLSLDGFSELMDTCVYQLLYHSRATAQLGEAELPELLERARHYNAEHHITGLLLHSNGYFVQVLEGEETAVRDLFAKIQQDPRHQEVEMVRQGPGPRRFAEWSMGFGHVAEPKLRQTLNAIDLEWPFRVPNIDDPHLQALLDAFV